MCRSFTKVNTPKSTCIPPDNKNYHIIIDVTFQVRSRHPTRESKFKFPFRIEFSSPWTYNLAKYAWYDVSDDVLTFYWKSYFIYQEKSLKFTIISLIYEWSINSDLYLGFFYQWFVFSEAIRVATWLKSSKFRPCFGLIRYCRVLIVLRYYVTD